MKRYPTKRYAKALFELSSERNQLKEVYEDVRQLKKLAGSLDDFIRFVKNPVIPSERRKEILNEIFKDKISPMTLEFLFLLERNRRLGLLEAICDYFENFYNAAEGIITATIISRTKLADQDVDSIRERFEEKFKKTIEPHVVVAAEILGGIKVKIADTVYDFSLQTQLERFRKKMLTA